MQSPFFFIVKPVGGKRYSSTKQVGGIDLIISTSEEDHRYSNREAEVIEVPSGYAGPIEKGDILLVHHNVFKFYNDMKGKRKSGRSFFKDDVFLIDPDQFFMYKKAGEWHAYDRYCFVKPVKAVSGKIMNPDTNQPLTGMMAYPNKYLLDRGVNKGDIVCFTPQSEYEFDVDGEVMYRVFDSMITMKLNGLERIESGDN